MSSSDRIGVYLNDKILVLADFNRNNLQKVLSAPLDSIVNASEPASAEAILNQETQIIAHIQKLFRENKIGAGQVNFSIPIEEVFLRSFVIPWMSAAELNNAVFYEAKKYLPFDLKLLDYVYQAVPQVEVNQKRWRIIFYAVRKQTTEKYERIIKQIGGKAHSFEPALVSLAKQLIIKKYLRMDQSTVVVYINDNNVHIIFYEKGIAYFVRDFALTVADVHDPKAVSEVIRSQLLREIRKSFGYYNSQFSQEKIKELLVLSAVPDEELARVLAEELAVKVRNVEPSITAGLQKYVGMETLSACGSCIEKVSSKFVGFNFLQAKNTSQPVAGSALTFDLSQFLGLTLADFKYALQAAVLCAVLLGGVFYYGQSQLQIIKKQSEQMTQGEGVWASKSVDQIKAEIKMNKDKLTEYRKIQKQENHIAAMIIDLTKALPFGVWLQDAKISTLSNDRLGIDISGYIYLKDTKGEYYQVLNEFLDNLRACKYFSDVVFNVTSQQKKEVDGHPVFAFSVSGN